MPPKKLKLLIYPEFRNQDKGDGGIRRVVEAQIKHLPALGFELLEIDQIDQADIIACHMTIPPQWLKQYPHKTFIAHCHGLYWSDYTWPNWAIKANVDVMESCRVADAVTAPSEWVASALRRHLSREVTPIVHGIDMEDWEHNEPNGGYVLWNKTRPDPVCDPTPVTMVAALLPNFKFETTFGEANLNVKVTDKLPYEEAKLHIQRAGVYLATTKETFGIGTLEAMAAGVPVVGFRWGGQPEIVREGIDGYLVRPNDHNALAQAITKAFANRDELGANAKQRAAEFSWKAAAEKYAALYRRLAAYKAQQRPKTSIVVTNYNLGKYLPQCLTSVLEQSDKDWECIIVDDASTEELGRVVAQTFVDKDPRFKLIKNTKNVYLAEARNIAIRHAKGRYILPLDADDMLVREAVETLSAALDTNRSIHIAYGGVRFVDEDGVTPTVYKGFNAGDSGWPMKFILERQILQQNLLPYSSMFRREVWQGTGGYSTRCRTAEDATFWTRAASYGYRPLMVAEGPMLIYRNRPGSMSQREGQSDWMRWFPWEKDAALLPAGAVTAEQQPIASLDQITVSVVIPVGPAHRHLVKDAVDSVDAQFYRNWECIVVYDGPGEQPELPAWVRVFETGPVAKGVAAARNLGIKNAHAPLFLPLDADDYLQPSGLELMVAAFLRSGDIIYSDFWEDPKEAGVYTSWKVPDYSPDKLKRGCIHSVTALTPISAWRKVGGYDEELPAWEDWDFQVKCAQLGICSRRLKFDAFVYRKHTGFRREDNMRNYEESKAGILAKWSALWNGGIDLMACGCGARPSVEPTRGQAQSGPGEGGDGLSLVEYTGNRAGSVPFKGYSGNYYTFAAGEQKYVKLNDVKIFENRADFRILPPQSIPAIALDEPVLIA